MAHSRAFNGTRDERKDIQADPEAAWSEMGEDGMERLSIRGRTTDSKAKSLAKINSASPP